MYHSVHGFCFRHQTAQLERDLQQSIDEKQDLETERDAYKTKHESLNRQLSQLLTGDERRVIDVDAVISENAYDRQKHFNLTLLLC